MNALFDVLNRNEKKALGRLAIAVCLFLALGSVLALRQRNAYLAAREAMTGLSSGSRKAEAALARAKNEWQRWQDAHRDLESFRTTYFYDAKTCIPTLMQDIRRIFSQAGANVSQIAYDYGEMAKGQIGRIGLTFSYRGSYQELKRFLSIIERFPRFLTIEKIDFVTTGSDGGPLNLKISLAGYYEI